MADIILINDQDQEQTLTGVEKLITRGTDGDVAFSLNGLPAYNVISAYVTDSSRKYYNLYPPAGFGALKNISLAIKSIGDAEYTQEIGTFLDGKLKVVATADWKPDSSNGGLFGGRASGTFAAAKIVNVSNSRLRILITWASTYISPVEVSECNCQVNTEIQFRASDVDFETRVGLRSGDSIPLNIYSGNSVATEKLTVKSIIEST